MTIDASGSGRYIGTGEKVWLDEVRVAAVLVAVIEVALQKLKSMRVSLNLKGFKGHKAKQMNAKGGRNLVNLVEIHTGTIWSSRFWSEEASANADTR